MKKKDIIQQGKEVYVIPPEPIDENKPACLADYLIHRSDHRIFNYDKVRRFCEDNFKLKIGGTTYEICTHFNPEGRQCVMEQFKELILSEQLI